MKMDCLLFDRTHVGKKAKMDIVVLCGGLSTERDVSFKTGSMVANALKKNSHRVIVLDVFMGFLEEEKDLGDVFARADEIGITEGNIPEQAPDLKQVRASRKDQSPVFFGPNVLQICRKSDIVFMALHGENGENGKVQAALDLFGVKYTGSDYLSSAIAMNKRISKQFFEAAGIPTPAGISLRKENQPEDLSTLGVSLPVIVKPCCGGSSIGVTIANTPEELKKALDDAYYWEEEVLIEEYIKGREFSVGVLEHKALPVIEIAPKTGFYDYKNKYKAGSTVETCPADLPKETAGKMQRYAEEVSRALGLDTYSRSDFLLEEDGTMYCLEANTLPGMTPTSLLPQEAAVVGIDFGALCEKLIEISLKKYA